MSKLSQWKSRAKSQGIPKRDASKVILASAGQKRLFSLQKMQGKSIFYQYGHLYRFEKDVDIADLEKRFINLIRTHDILRSNYELIDDQVVVNIKKDFEFKIAIDDQYDSSFFQESFDLESDLLIRAKLFEGNILALSIHHIIADRQSLMLINKEVFGEQSQGKPIHNYFDYTSWSNGLTTGNDDLSYWKASLDGELPILSLPHDKHRIASPNYQGNTHIITLNNEQSTKIKQVANYFDTTLYVFILSAFNVLLSKYSNQRDILVGTPVSNRDRKELDEMIGFFNETMVLRNLINHEQPFSELVKTVKDNFLQGLSHKNVSFSKLVHEVNPTRIPGVNPLFQAMFLFNKHDEYFSYDSQFVNEEVVDLSISKFDLTLFAIEKGEELILKLEYSTELFEDQTARNFNESLSDILLQISENPTLRIGEIKVGHELSYNESALPLTSIEQNSILDLVDFSSAGIAAAYCGEEITYIELGEQSELLAKTLVQEGVKPNDFVGLYVERSLEMLVGIVAILKAGAAYLPLDPSYPVSRLVHMISDSGCEIVLSSASKTLESVKNIDLKKERKVNSNVALPNFKADGLAYIIYTSGSSGEPKGVPITHNNLLHSTTARFDFYPENPTAFLLMSSFSFDSSVAGIFWTLCSGGKLVLPRERIEQDIDLLSEVISQQEVSHSLMLPSLYQILLKYSDPNQLSSLKIVMVAGEACSLAVVQNHFNVLPGCRLYNEYGPTEGTVWCIAHEFKKEDTEVVIGRPIPHYKAYVLADDQSHVPDGVIGELYIGGDGLAAGYWRQESLSSSKFVRHSDFDRLYRTGDLAKFDNLGNLHFCGRSDSQVKILGHRVELDEIRNKILNSSPISEAIVVLNKKNLVAYIDQDVDVVLDLPDYMTPSSYVFLPEFPRLPNGKIDLSKLPDPEKKSAIRRDPREISPLEDQLLNIWKELLNDSRIGVNDNFFDVGGDSLISIQFVAIARKAGINLFASALFEHQTIKKLAAHLAKFKEDRSLDIVVPLQKGGSRRPLFCIHGGGAHVFFYKKFAEYLSSDIPVYSFQPKSLDGKSSTNASIAEMSQLYVAEMKKVQAHGPYQILGTCFSNAVAIEMAAQLEAGGDKVEKLFIIDSAPVHLFGNNEQNENQTFQRFLDMLKRGDFSRIRSKIQRRIFGQKEWESSVRDATEADQVLKETVNSLNQMYADYNWKAFSGRINFIRSSEFHGRNDKKYHMTQWNKLAIGGLDVTVVDGHHLTLFEDPEVKGLAKEVEQLLSEN